jgi:hypothetical protein
VTLIPTSSTKRLLQVVEQLRSLPEMQRRTIASRVFAELSPWLDTMDLQDLRSLRRKAQDERALRIYAGARDFSDIEFALATMMQEWVSAKLELCGSDSLATKVPAERRIKAIEDFVRDNLPE